MRHPLGFLVEALEQIAAAKLAAPPAPAKSFAVDEIDRMTELLELLAAFLAPASVEVGFRRATREHYIVASCPRCKRGRHRRYVAFPEELTASSARAADLVVEACRRHLFCVHSENR